MNNKAIAMILLTIGFISVIVIVSVISHLSNGEQSTVDIGAFGAFALAITQILKWEDNNVSKEKHSKKNKTISFPEENTKEEKLD